MRTIQVSKLLKKNWIWQKSLDMAKEFVSCRAFKLRVCYYTDNNKKCLIKQAAFAVRGFAIHDFTLLHRISVALSPLLICSKPGLTFCNFAIHMQIFLERKDSELKENMFYILPE